MMNRSRFTRLCACVALTLAATVAVQAQTTYVRPKIGGAQMGHTQAPMIMPEIFFDGVGMHVLDANGLPWPAFPWCQAPVLRPLAPSDQFDPNQPWAVLIGKAYNFQYGWDSALLDAVTHPFPAGSAIWVKMLKQSPELEVYFKDGGYAPLFGTPDAGGAPSSDIWMWDKRMRHNTYAVPESFYGRLSGDYKVYLGDAVSGAEFLDPNGLPLYGSRSVTLRWLRPCPYLLQGDINSDCVVDSADLLLVADAWLTPPCSAPGWCDECDIDHDGTLNMVDMTLVMDHWLIDCRNSPLDPACTPRP
jgi:hypothetical protein